MFALRLIEAHHGDCFLLHYGTASKPRHILVDGGPWRVFDQHLAGTLKRFVGRGKKLDRVICSHSDTDHTIGLLDLLGEVKSELDAGEVPTARIGGLWHNSFADTLGQAIANRTYALLETVQAHGLSMTESEAMFQGIADGRQLRRLARMMDIELNEGKTKLSYNGNGSPPEYRFGNLRLKVFGPLPSQLRGLQSEWRAWLKANEDEVARGRVDLAANSDQSKRNLASIHVYARAHGKTMLLTGDGRGDHIEKGLRKAGLTDSQNRLHVDLLKLPHHGSDRNITKGFIERITADIYAVSGNHEHENPDYDTLRWLVEAAHAQGRRPHIVATYYTPNMEKLQQTHPRSTYGYRVSTIPKTGHSKLIRLAS